MAKGRRGEVPQRLREIARSTGFSAGRGARTFFVNTTKRPDALLDKAKRAAEANGAILKGNTTAGGFSGGGVRGNYKIEDRAVRITITDKPGFVPWSIVEDRIRGFFN